MVHTQVCYFLAPNAFENAFIIFDVALYLAVGVSWTCLMLILFSFWALFRSEKWNAHFGNMNTKKSDQTKKRKNVKGYILVDDSEYIKESTSASMPTLIDRIGDFWISSFLGPKRYDEDGKHSWTISCNSCIFALLSVNMYLNTWSYQ